MRRCVAGLIRLYQVCLSPLLGQNCRFVPSCSETARRAVLEEGVLRGLRRGVRQLLRCHPWGREGP